MDTQDRTHKIICHDCGGNGYRRDCYGEVYQCKNCKSQGEITFTEEEMLENIDDAGAIVWKEKYLVTMVIGVLKKRNAFLKLYMKRGPNDLDEIINRLKKENIKLKNKLKFLSSKKLIDKILKCKESM